ncbi:MAG TPA: hypothetical protein VG675_05470 [Bryobacteraceae bacterium]|nr:hypothetical protein [Bryobacteraceae bacterium]
MPNVTTAAGDCFNSIAKAQGFFNYLTVYNHSDNATNFPNPNCLEEGSTVKVPEKQMKAFVLTLDAENKFKIIRKKTKLKVKVCKANVAQQPGMSKVTLDIGGKKATATTGVLDIDDIDASISTATLTVVLSDPPAYAAPPAPSAGTANQYPDPILAADFDDPKTVWPKKGETITWNLQVGSLEPHTVIRGVLQRLENLGFTCPVQKTENAATRRAVKTYRRAVENKVAPNDTDAVADIRAHIKARHDD